MNGGLFQACHLGDLGQSQSRFALGGDHLDRCVNQTLSAVRFSGPFQQLIFSF